MPSPDDTLAIEGGEPAVQIDDPEQWERDVEEEKRRVNELIEEGVMTGAGYGVMAEFEEDFGDYVGAEYCVTVDHGSTALGSAYYAVGVGPGDEVITPAAGYLGAYEGALHMGARPVFCELDEDTQLADPEDVEERITERTKAINLIHSGGRVCDMDAFRDLADDYDLALVEDAAHAHGAEWDGDKVGSVGDITCFSLQGVTPHGKPVAGGEGGIVTTNDRELYERNLSYCHLHRRNVTDELTLEPYKNLDRQLLGRKWRAYPLAIAIATVSFESLDYRVNNEIEWRNRINDAIEDIPGLKPVATYPESDSGGLYGGMSLQYEPDAHEGVSAERFVEAASEEGVPLRGPGIGHIEHTRYIHQEGYDLWGEGRGPLGDEWCGLPPYEGYEEGDFPVTEGLREISLGMPTYIDPVDGYFEQVIAGLEKVAANADQLT